MQISSTGGKWNTNIVKNEICIQVDKMNLYVAPTYINLEKPTFWKPNNPKPEEGKQMSSQQYLDGEGLHTDEEEKLDNHKLASMNDMEDNEHINALRKVLSFSSVNLKFVFLDENSYDH